MPKLVPQFKSNYNFINCRLIDESKYQMENQQGITIDALWKIRIKVVLLESIQDFDLQVDHKINALGMFIAIDIHTPKIVSRAC